MTMRTRMFRTQALCGAALFSMAISAQAHGQTAIRFHISPQALAPALFDFSSQSGMTVVIDETLTRGKMSAGLTATSDPELALHSLLRGTGLTVRRRGRIFFVGTDKAAAVAPPQDTGETVPGDIVVTARKREESIQDVPVAITAVTQAELTTRQVTGGPDLITQVPNMTFTKTNFTGYSIQIRGIGTQAVSATVDPAVSVAFNNTPFIRNRFFEQEFYDLERIEILRGPQGTLYGRNATAGVVNLISAKPGWEPAAKASFDYGSYNQYRGEGMINVPLMEDKLALRVAGAFTKRDGYAYNSLTDKPIDGRDLWSTRATLRFKPTDDIDANVVWEHFQENDDRLRSGKQLCATDQKTEVAGFAVENYTLAPDANRLSDINRVDRFGPLYGGVQARFSQGCKAASLYSDRSFGVPQGLSLPYYAPLGAIGLPAVLGDPYISQRQSTDLRTIESARDPNYRARADIFALQVGATLFDQLRLTSETAYNRDFTFSEQDFNRFNTARGAFGISGRGFEGLRKVFIPQDYYVIGNIGYDTINNVPIFGPQQTGIFCDPQIGCSDRLVGVDLATAKSMQFSQELRLTSQNRGPFNFSVGVNFLRYRTTDKYYVFFNSLTATAATGGFIPADLPSRPPYAQGQSDQGCLPAGLQLPNPRRTTAVAFCTYIDPNPIGKLNDLGHNYFLSKNPYQLSSYSTFGEGYYDLSDTLKATFGGRLTVDRKRAPRLPSYLLGSNTAGLPVATVVRQRWIKPTGKISVDWKPVTTFSDSTLAYVSASRGYKAGGANPPPAGALSYNIDYLSAINDPSALVYAQRSATRPATFKAEYVNALEVGTKNEFFSRQLTLNLAAFFYDYKNYQISQIIDRSAVNLNFDAQIWGAELESSWQATDFLQLGLRAGYQRSRLGKGSRAIDTMDRTAGNSDWTVVKPFPTYTSNCILPTALFQGVVPDSPGVPPALVGQPQLITLGGLQAGGLGACELAYAFRRDPVTDLPYVPNPTAQGSLGMLDFKPGYAGFDPSTAPNNGEGFFKNLEGKELPNAPHFTISTNADLSLPLVGNWIGTLHGDLYYQDKQWARVFNTPGFDRIRGYANVNLAVLLNNRPGGWSIMAYMKNVFDVTAITGSFLNSDDTGLTTNIFLTEPRRYGLRVIKDFDGLPFGLGNTDTAHRAGTPYEATLEGGVTLLKRQAAVEPYRPSFAAAFTGLDALTPLQRDRQLPRKDGTDLSLKIQPTGSLWNLTARLRYGKLENDRRGRADRLAAPICLPGSIFEERESCFPGGSRFDDTQFIRLVNYNDSLSRDRERHLVVDFLFGREAGGEGRARTSIALGARYAALSSQSDLEVSGVPNNDQPFDFVFSGIKSFQRYQSQTAIRRRFVGAGPALEWQGAYDVIGTNDAGRVAIEGSAATAVMFGNRRTRAAGTETETTYGDDPNSPDTPFSPKFFVRRFLASGGYTIAPTGEVSRATSFSRSNTATVPTLGGSLGLSYTLGRIAVKGGYNWERYFNAIDGGNASGAKAYNRTIHGPYLKLAFGFGR